MKLLPALFIVFCFASPSFAEVGDRPLGWSERQSSDFRDYAIRHFNRQGEVLNHYWLHYWLQQKLLELNFASTDPIDATIPVVFKSDEVNAFAIPGNIIGINRGLLLEAETEAQFISVLAHEMAHISLDHFSRLADGSRSQSWALAGGILLTILLSPENPELANALLFGSLASTEQSRLNYSRAMELEADQLAQEMMSAADYDTEAGRRFFEKLNQFSANAYEYLRTHPLGNTRATRLSAGQTSTTAKTDSELFQLFREDLNDTLAAKSLNFEQAPNDPNLRLAQLLLDPQRTEKPRNFEEQLAELIKLYPQFLPAQVYQLKHQLAMDSPNLCDHFNQMQRRFENEFATLDVFEALKTAAEQCQHNSADFWHSQLLWYSGKEEQAISFLAARLKTQTQTNQAARLRIRIAELSERYERFR